MHRFQRGLRRYGRIHRGVLLKRIEFGFGLVKQGQGIKSERIV